LCLGLPEWWPLSVALSAADVRTDGRSSARIAAASLPVAALEEAATIRLALDATGTGIHTQNTPEASGLRTNLGLSP
jgi:hypothetical protein